MKTRFKAEQMLPVSPLWRVIDTQEAELIAHDIREVYARIIAKALNEAANEYPRFALD